MRASCAEDMQYKSDKVKECKYFSDIHGRLGRNVTFAAGKPVCLADDRNGMEVPSALRHLNSQGAETDRLPSHPFLASQTNVAFRRQLPFVSGTVDGSFVPFSVYVLR